MQQTTPHIPYDLPKIKTFSPDLQQAINQIYLWVKDGCPEHDVLSKGTGLCWNLGLLLLDHFIKDINQILWYGNEYPFNEGGEEEYYREQNKFTNPKRLAWLQEHQTVE